MNCNLDDYFAERTVIESGASDPFVIMILIVFVIGFFSFQYDLSGQKDKDFGYYGGRVIQGICLLMIIGFINYLWIN